MKQAISGVAPSSASEVTVMTVFPSIGGTSIGQTLGRLMNIKAGFGNVLNLGNLIALLSVPLVLPLIAINLNPFNGRRYRLTNRRVIIERGWRGVEERSVGLGSFDTVDLLVQPGEDWFPCGDLIFRKGNLESLRLSGVPHPEGFRRTCLKMQRAYAGVKRSVAP